jgi:hypothetical protein
MKKGPIGFCIAENGIDLQDFILMRLFNLISLLKAGVLKAAQFKREKGNGPLNRLRDWVQLRMPSEESRQVLTCSPISLQS